MNPEKQLNENLFSIVIPAYNEQGAIRSLIKEIESVFNKWKKNCEIIVVDDGSTDKTAQEVKKTDAKLIIFKKNYGQSSALNEGINRAKGDYIITMDGDGQNDPDDIPKLFRKMKKKKLDMICGWRNKRKDCNSIKLGAKLAYKIRFIVLNDEITDSGCTLKIFKRKTTEDLNLFRGMHRFIPALLKIEGNKVGEMKVNHRPRKSGRTKYNWLKYFPGILGLLTVLQIRLNKAGKKINLPYLVFLVLVITTVILNLTGKINRPVNLLLVIPAIFLFWLGKTINKEVEKHYSYSPKYKIKEVIN